MWIRTQDKLGLVEAHKVKLTKAYFIVGGYTYNKEGYIVTCDGDEIGSYSTEERALGILDEIQKAIINSKVVVAMLSRLGLTQDKIIDEKIQDKIKHSIVYEMPQDEVENKNIKEEKQDNE